MKNRKNIFAALAACAAMIFASCSNLTDANVSSNSENRNPLNVEITNYDDILSDVSVQANTDSRTIIPDSFDADGVDFYIFGTNVAGGTLTPTQVTFTGKDGTSKTVGTVDIPADANIWDFTLVAVPTGDPATSAAEAVQNAVLIGYDTVDMLNGDVAKFTLAPDGLTKEGEIAMKLYTDGWPIPTGFTAKAGIYLLTTGADATATGDGTGTATEAAAAFTDATVDEANAVSYAVASMKPGTYLFKVTFTNDTGKRNFYYSDVIVVLPGKTIDEVVGIPNVIGTIPAAPTAFKAGYVASTEDKYNGIYITEFEWVRPTSKNESYLEIDLLELADATTALPGADAAWTTAIDTDGSVSTTYGMDFAASGIYESGSILSGNKTVQVKLELGKRYAARIRAVNDAGASDYAYVALSDTTNGTAFTSTVINRYRIKYYLNSGTLYPTANDAENKTSGSTTNVVVYDCERTGVAILNGTVAPNIIKKGDYTWSYWSTDATTASKYPMTGDPAAPEAYTGYANLDLYAIFTTNAEVEIFDKASLKILPGWITMDTTPLTGNTATKDYANVTGDKIVWVITPADIKAPDGTTTIENFAYDSVTFTVSKSGTTYYAATETGVGYGSGAGAGTAGTFELPVSSLAAGAGVYQVMFTAVYKTTTVSLPVTFTYTR